MLEKMSRSVVSLLLLLTSAMVCQIRADPYSQLDSKLKKFVDMTILKANQQFHNSGHLNFFEFGTVKEVSPRVRMDIRLQNTNCRKVSDARGHRHRPECPFKQLQVWCVVCSPFADSNQPFIGCVRRKNANMRDAMIKDHCLLHGQFAPMTLTGGKAV